MSFDLPSLPPALNDAFGAPSGALAFDSPIGTVALWIFAFEDSFVLATSTLAPVIGVDVTLRTPREPGEERPNPVLPQMLQAILTAWLSGERVLTHGEAAPIIEPSLGLVLPMLALRDTEIGDGGWIRLVHITDTELELLGRISAEGLQLGLQASLPGLVSILSRDTVVTAEQAEELAESHPVNPRIERTFSLVWWAARGEEHGVHIDEAALTPLEVILENPSRSLVARDDKHTVEFHVGEDIHGRVREDGDRLILNLPPDAIRELIRNKIVGLGEDDALLIEAIAVDVQRAPLEELLREPPTRSLPRVAHALFATRVVPAVADELFEELQTTNATNVLRVRWGELNGLLASGQLGGVAPGMDADPQPHWAVGTVPGTRVEARVGLGVATYFESSAHRIFVVQMPPAQAPAEAHYLALAKSEHAPVRVLAWEKTTQGYATLAEWWLEEGGPKSEILDKQGSAHLDQFVAQIEAWLTLHPERPGRPAPTTTTSRKDDLASRIPRRPPIVPDDDDEELRPRRDWVPAVFAAVALVVLLLGIGVGVYLLFPGPIHLSLFGENESLITPATASAKTPSGEPVLETPDRARWGTVATRDGNRLRLLRDGVLYEGPFDLAYIRPQPVRNVPVALRGEHYRFESGKGPLGSSLPFAEVDLHLGPIARLGCRLWADGMPCEHQDTFGGRLPDADLEIVDLIALGDGNGATYGCALRVDGRAFCFGRPDAPDLSDLGVVRQIAPMGRRSVCGLTIGGDQVRCVGLGAEYGFRALGSTDTRVTELPEPAVALVTRVSRRGADAIAVTEAGTIYAVDQRAVRVDPQVRPSVEEELRTCACALSEQACAAFEDQAASAVRARSPLELPSRAFVIGRFAWQALFEPLDPEVRPECADLARVVFRDQGRGDY